MRSVGKKREKKNVSTFKIRLKLVFLKTTNIEPSPAIPSCPEPLLLLCMYGCGNFQTGQMAQSCSTTFCAHNQDFV